jgi:hypothetical protein
MILKIKSNNGWRLIDNIEDISYHSIIWDKSIDKSNILNLTTHIDEFFVTLENPNLPSGEYLCIEAICKLRSGEVNQIIFDTKAFLLNDEGQTIEKIRGDKTLDKTVDFLNKSQNNQNTDLSIKENKLKHPIFLSVRSRPITDLNDSSLYKKMFDEEIKNILAFAKKEYGWMPHDLTKLEIKLKVKDYSNVIEGTTEAYLIQKFEDVLYRKELEEDFK